MRRGYAESPAHDHGQADGRLFGTFGSLANSPASARRMKSASALSVRYGLPAMFTVVSQPLFRQRQAVVAEMPAFSQNLCRLKMGLPSISKIEDLFTPAGSPQRFALMKEIHALRARRAMAESLTMLTANCSCRCPVTGIAFYCERFSESYC
jgi:hypothetical protein